MHPCIPPPKHKQKTFKWIMYCKNMSLKTFVVIIRVTKQLDIVVSPPAFVWNPNLTLNHVTFDLDPCDLRPWLMWPWTSRSHVKETERYRDRHRDGNYRLSACPGQRKNGAGQVKVLDTFSEGKVEFMELTLCLCVEDRQGWGKVLCFFEESLNALFCLQISHQPPPPPDVDCLPCLAFLGTVHPVRGSSKTSAIHTRYSQKSEVPMVRNASDVDPR